MAGAVFDFDFIFSISKSNSHMRLRHLTDLRIRNSWFSRYFYGRSLCKGLIFDHLN